LFIDTVRQVRTKPESTFIPAMIRVAHELTGDRLYDFV
jgi:hypothetical protein